MDNDNDKGRFRLIEMIMVNPFNNWSFSFVGTVRKIRDGNKDSYYFGMVEIELDKICCVCQEKDLVAKNLEFIYTLKYQYTGFRKKYRTHQTPFAELILN